MTARETTASILARMDQRLSHIEAKMEAILVRQSAEHQDHERRIRSLETYKTWLLGVGATIGAGVTALIAWIKGER